MTHARFFKVAAGFSILAAAFFAQESPGPVIKTETRLVLVDAVVTNKKGDYVRDLTQKDFKVYEDNKEQTISSFSFEADPASPSNNQPRYLVLFFDNSTMSFEHQKYAREAAGKFVAANAGPKRMMAVVEYGASMRVVQNFTDDGERLKQVVSGVRLAPQLDDTGGLAGVGLSRAAGAYGTRNIIIALQTLVKNLADVPGRKSLVLLSAGFRMTPEITTEINSLIDACNKANVAVYPIDARGLVAANRTPDNGQLLAYGGFRPIVPGLSFFFQARGGVGTANPGSGVGTTRPPAGGGGTANPGSGGTTIRPPSGGTNTPGTGNVPRGTTNTTGGSSGAVTQPTIVPNRAMIMPRILPNVTDNQQPLYALASGTGGFVIVNTNDLLSGLQKIGKEQNEHYMIGYTPENFEEGKCHSLKVKVTQSGYSIRARTGYCDAKPKDPLSGNPVEKDLEKIIVSSVPGSVAATMQAPFFYTGVNSARMNVAVEIPTAAVKFDKKKGKYHGAMNVLGMVYRPDGGVAAKFSDTLKFDFDDKKSMEAWQERPSIRYEKDVEGVPGNYTLKMVVGSNASSFAKIELPITIEPYDGKKMSLSSLAYSTEMRKISQMEAGVDSAMAEDRTPLIVSGLQLFPAGRNSFKKTETVALYAELYDPSLVATEPVKDFAAAIQMRLLDAKTGAVKLDSGLMRQPNLQQGNPVIPLALKLPVDKLEAGSYVCEITGADTTGAQIRRTSPFSVQ